MYIKYYKYPDIKLIFYVLIFLLFKHVNLIGQDPAYHNFAQNRMLFNPSLVGNTGTHSWHARSKMQWNNKLNGYRTFSLMVEEALPCSITDYGIKMNYNEEGDALYKTLEIGVMSSVFYAIEGTKHTCNIKLGLDFTWGRNSIDWSRLVWSDQLDPIRGNVLPTSFVPPTDGSSVTYVYPGLGASFKAVFNRKSRKPTLLNLGFAGYRFISFGQDKLNQSISVLGLKSTNPYRLTAFVDFELIGRTYLNHFFKYRPMILVQKQGELYYLELGCRAGLNNDYGLGVYYHVVPFSDGQTPWCTVTLDYLHRLNRRNKVQVNFSYSFNTGGLQNFVGPQFELGFSYHINRSFICKALGKTDQCHSEKYGCENFGITPGNRKIYEQIWYKE